jgi:hypothetical protein
LLEVRNLHRKILSNAYQLLERYLNMLDENVTPRIQREIDG